jgi:hypothetical protein
MRYVAAASLLSFRAMPCNARRLSSRVGIVSNRFCSNDNAAEERLIASADIAAWRASVLS